MKRSARKKAPFFHSRLGNFPTCISSHPLLLRPPLPSFSLSLSLSLSLVSVFRLFSSLSLRVSRRLSLSLSSFVRFWVPPGGYLASSSAGAGPGNLAPPVLTTRNPPTPLCQEKNKKTRGCRVNKWWRDGKY